MDKLEQSDVDSVRSRFDIECEDFYNLCQSYRHAPFEAQYLAVENYDALIKYINGKLNEAYQAGLSANKWQTIETAPIKPFEAEFWYKQHSPFLLLWTGNYCEIGSYGFTEKGKGRWQGRHGIITPTHWQYLPEKP